METNLIIIRVLWIIIAVLILTFLAMYIFNLGKKIKTSYRQLIINIYILISIIILLSTFSFSIYLAHTDKNDTQPKPEWVFSAIFSGLWFICSLYTFFNKSIKINSENIITWNIF
jgi:NADH:ubiquinone oxidoreductase subunit 6 (subunit J)